MASRGNVESFIMEVASYNFLYGKTSKEYKNTKMKICVKYIIMNTSTPENKGIINKKILSSMRCIQLIQPWINVNVESLYE